MSAKKRQRNGYTLIEVMTTVTIISILAGMSVVGFRRALGHQRLVGETNTAAATMKYIASEARVGKREVSVNIDLDENSFIGWFDSDSDGVQDSVEEVVDKFKAPVGVDLYSGMIGTHRISGEGSFVFLDDGSTNKAVVFVLKSDATNEYKTVMVNRTSGWVEVFKGVPSGLE